jgi:hypothetical protein
LRETFEQQVPADWFVMDETQLQLTETGFLMSDAILQNFI